MVDRPIIFSAPMVRALLAGRKTQTRRIIKLPPVKDRRGQWEATDFGGPGVTDSKGNPVLTLPGLWHTQTGKALAAGFKPGDRLWVREACDDQHPLAIQDGRYSQPGRAGIPGPPPVSYKTIYRVDGEPLQIWRSGAGYPYFKLDGPEDEVAEKYPTVCSNFVRAGKGIYWCSPIHMPRRASRLTLIVTDVLVQRLQDISEDDAKAEGMAEPYLADGDPPFEELSTMLSRRKQFRNLWRELRGPDAWDANPWVVAIVFSVHKRNIDAMEGAIGV